MRAEDILHLDTDKPILIQFTDGINDIRDCKFASGMKAYITAAYFKAEGLIVNFEEKEFAAENSNIFNPHKYPSIRNYYCVGGENGEVNCFEILNQNTNDD